MAVFFFYVFLVTGHQGLSPCFTRDPAPSPEGAHFAPWMAQNTFTQSLDATAPGAELELCESWVWKNSVQRTR
jgi:hypothetical protein